MIMKQRNTSLLLRNKGVLLLSISAVILFFYACSKLFAKPCLYNKLQGEYNVLWEYTEVYRNFNFRPIASILEIKNNKIELPCMLSTHDKIEGAAFEVWKNNQKGTWEIISQDPDSILIETPASILNGKYAVFFQKEQLVAHPPMYILILQNDSTRLCFSKVVEPYAKMDWE